MLRRAVAPALVAAALAPAAASADPPLPDPPPVHTFCEVYWLRLPVVVGDTTVIVPIPRIAC